VGANPWNQILQIWNSTGGTLNWQVTSNALWLKLGPSDADPYTHSGSSTGEVNYVDVYADVTVPWPAAPPPMSAGSYTGTITIADTNALNSPQTVPVYLTIKEPVMVERLGIPALTANTWTEVILQLSNASKICPDYSVALYATRDPGLCILWLDDIRASTEASPGPYTFVITVTLAGGGS